MKKSLICLLLALSLCLCMVLASCKKDPEVPGEDPNPTEQTGDGGEKKGEIYYTPDAGGSVEAPENNDKPEGGTIRY